VKWHDPCTSGSSGPRREMVAYVLMGVLAVLAFLCLSDGIPELARRESNIAPPSKKH